MTDRVRVAQIITRFTAGAGGVALRGALALDPDRYATTIIAAAGGSLFAEAERAGFEVVGLRHMNPELSLRDDVRCFRELSDILGANRFDVVHTHSAKAGAIGRAAARSAKVPAVVHTFHGFPFHDFQSRARRRTYIALERKLARVTDEFLAVGSAVAAEAIRRRIVPVDRVRVIDSAVDPQIPRVSRATRLAARQTLRVPPGMRVVGTVARLDHQKAPHDLVAAMVALDRPDVLMVWIGGGPLHDAVTREVAKQGLTERFILLGEQPDVPSLLPAFDVFALPSLYEGLPCAVVEAMMCGIPVVATAVNAVHEVVVPGKTGLLVRPRDPDGMARALGHLLDNPHDGERLVCAARLHLEGRFAPHQLGIDLAETYERALSLTGRGPALALLRARRQLRALPDEVERVVS